MGLHAESKAACSPCIAKSSETSKVLHRTHNAGQAGDLLGRIVSAPGS